MVDCPWIQMTNILDDDNVCPTVTPLLQPTILKNTGF